MADFFTHFSCILDVGSPANVTRARERYHALAERLERDEATPIGFMLGVADTHPTTLWIRDDDTSGEPQHVIAFVSELGPALGLTGRWGFEWAHTCSKPRLDTFGGGAHALDLATGAEIGWLSTNEWLTRMLADPDNAEEA
ncbi:hypothetical protein [Arvimicrobium flavum]|uniref:hypothetical protein n=1 Tax=Arvimicrobium flavum TaxID=3393320 RepID=UPI00237A1134|nr:hypothetical protein [Mesorhizobium shangrilense]